MSVIALVLSVIIALIVGIIVTAITVKLRLGDTAVARSSHIGTIPTAGGLGILASIIALITACGFVVMGLNISQLYIILALTLLLGAVGLYDDVKTAGSVPRLVAMIGIAGLATTVLRPELSLGPTLALPAITALIGAALGLVVTINAVNFMDGVNGMMIAVSAPAAVTVMVVSAQAGDILTAICGLAVVTGLAAFAPFNFRPSAKIFAGDVGALSVGFLLGVVILGWATLSPAHLYAAPILILPMLIDVFMTLIRRLRSGENILQAHNQHLFQRFVQSGQSHIRVSVIYATASVFCAVLATALSKVTPILSAIGAILVTGFGALIYMWAYAHLARKSAN